MIYYNSNIINDWNFGDDNIIKVYHNGVIVFYKFDSEQGGYKVCYAVVDDIKQYSETEFEDVYDKATEKWYKLNNLNQYEEYGIYGSGRSVTTYNGKLTIDDGYEYEWNGSSWANLGEVTGSSRVPDGYVELTHVQTIKQDVPKTSAFTIPIDIQSSYNYIIEFMPLDWSNSSYYGDILGNDGDTNFPSYGLFKFDNGWGTEWRRTTASFWNYSFDTRSGKPADSKYRFYDNTKARVTMHLHNYDAAQGSDMIVENEGYPTSAVTSTSAQKSGYVVSTGVYNSPLFCTQTNNMRMTAYMNFYNLKIETNENVAVYDYIPCKRKSDNKVGLYDVVHNVFYAPLFNLNAGDEASHIEYPKYYSEKSEPLDNLTFNTMAEAQAYAEANCVYDGLKATIGADRYYFDSTDENGWVKVTEYYIVEDVTPGGASGWTISGSDTYNPDSSYYDDFDLQTNWSSFSYKIAKVTIYGYDHFTYYLRANHPYTYSYAYVMATNVDEIQTPPSTMSYGSSSAITNTYNRNISPKAAVNLSNYRRVTYNNLDKTVEHTFYVYFYGRTYINAGNATILIPKEQTNENWEQVTFSASSNVASYQKTLYIDNNIISSGGTQYWYYRWIVGLPSGSHSSYTNNMYYNYCPNVTSSTFTSVAGEQRQINFTYDGTSDKTLSFRLTDGSNVLTPSNIIYYNMTYYNSCGVSTSSSNVTFPRSLTVKVGGSFSFSNSSNRHYIYGYQPPTLGTRYYADNYQDTFDITYTKLSDETVTITYTTYDPSDTEVPSFKTDITYPYNGGTTSSTTLTSYTVPYTYPYKVSQTSDKFSADAQSYTANQAARTINFVLYPNNREFATVADLEAYQYAWEGMRAYVGTDKYVYQNGEWVYNPSRLPQGYTEVEYVQNTGTSYFDTNFKPNTNTRILTEMQAVSSANYPRLFGAGAWNAAAGINLDYQTDGGQNCLHIGWYGRTSWSYYTSFTFDYDKHTYDLNKNSLYRDETLVGSTSYTTSYQSTDNLGVFTYISGGRPSASSYWGQEHFKGKMYSFKVYDNGTLVRDLVPCIKDSDNTVGAYDIVNDVFYTVPTGYTTDKLVAGDPV